MENDLGIIYKILGNKENATIWTQKAEARAALINHYLWDDKAGYYFDYNFKTKQLKPYIYATTFYPLWQVLHPKTKLNRL